MEESKQLELIKHFMVVLAPEVARHRLALLRHRQVVLPVSEEGEADHTEFALQIAKLTLQLAMHLAAHYGGCYDSLHSEPYWKKETDDPPR
jgi:hypothetical protein